MLVVAPLDAVRPDELLEVIAPLRGVDARTKRHPRGDQRERTTDNGARDETAARALFNRTRDRGQQQERNERDERPRSVRVPGFRKEIRGEK